MDIFTRLRQIFGIRNADEFIAHRPEENLAMLRQRLSGLEAALLAAPPHAQGSPEAVIHAEATRIIALPRARTDDGTPMASWDDVLRCEIMMAWLAQPASLPAELARRLERLKHVDPGTHAPLAAEWENMQAASEAQGTTLDTPRARGLLATAIEAAQVRDAQRYLVRKLGVLYAGRLVTTFVLAIGFGLGMVFWEVYTPRWPLTDARFSGFAIALVAGLLGASFSALTRQRDIAGMMSLEEVRTAIGYPMILLRLGVGVGAAAILYFVFESGLVDGLLFPDLNAIGFGPVLLGGAEGQALTVSLEQLRSALANSAGQAEALADRLGEAVEALAATAPGREALGAMSAELSGLGAALHGLGAELGPRSDTELGRYVPNTHLSKLVVWSFLAGFSEVLVPNILGRVESGAEAK
jgi:hypothetical protein